MLNSDKLQKLFLHRTRTVPHHFYWKHVRRNDYSKQWKMCTYPLNPTEVNSLLEHHFNHYTPMYYSLYLLVNWSFMMHKTAYCVPYVYTIIWNEYSRCMGIILHTFIKAQRGIFRIYCLYWHPAYNIRITIQCMCEFEQCSVMQRSHGD